MNANKNSKWASNLVSGIGLGTSTAIKELGFGVYGVVGEPYKGAKSKGIKGGAVGFGKGIAGLVTRPIKGGFNLIAQPIVGVVNTPFFLHKKLFRSRTYSSPCIKMNCQAILNDEYGNNDK